MSGEHTFTLRQVADQIDRALKERFPEKIWIVGEIQGLDRNRRGKHWYFQLCETEGEKEVCRLPAVIWKGIRDKLFGPSGKLTRVINPNEAMDGIKIRALCQIDYYAPYGKINLLVNDIDPSYTLGDLEAQRQALLEKLTKQGILQKNRDHELPIVPLRVGLITSDGSAAYNDFMKELESSGMAFKVHLCDARMQGEDAPPTIRAALKTLAGLDLDLLVLIRGGGSRLDLSWFDREELVQAIIHCPLPVITGIGHEIDVSLCEMAAHTGMKTPTAAAAFLVDRVKNYLAEILEIGAQLDRATRENLSQRQTGLREHVQILASRTRLRLTGEAAFFQGLPRTFASETDHFLVRARSALDHAAGTLASGRHIRRFENLRLDLSQVALHLVHGWSKRKQSESHNLEMMDQRCRLLNPVRVLARGYALLRDTRGKALKSVDNLAPSDSFSAVLRDGKVFARVEKTEKEDDHVSEEQRQLEIW